MRAVCVAVRHVVFIHALCNPTGQSMLRPLLLPKDSSLGQTQRIQSLLASVRLGRNAIVFHLSVSPTVEERGRLFVAEW